MMAYMQVDPRMYLLLLFVLYSCIVYLVSAVYTSFFLFLILVFLFLLYLRPFCPGSMSGAPGGVSRVLSGVVTGDASISATCIPDFPGLWCGWHGDAFATL